MTATTPTTPPLGSDELARRSARSRRRWWSLILAAVVAELAIGAAVLLAVTDDGGGGGDTGGGPATYTYEVPLGTWQRIQDGEQVFVMPNRIQLDVGDRLVIVNHDDRDHAIGPFSVRAGETIGHTFEDASTYTGICTVDPSGTIEIIVV